MDANGTLMPDGASRVSVQVEWLGYGAAHVKC